MRRCIPSRIVSPLVPKNGTADFSCHAPLADEKLYPSLAGPTMILNLPLILQAFVGLFKPLFPKSVQERLKFGRAPFLSKLGELTPLTTDSNTRKSFLAEVENLLDPGFFATKDNM